MKLKIAVMLLLLPTLAAAQGATDQRSAILLYDYNLASTSYLYCRYEGSGGSPFGAEIPGAGLIQTTGSSATLDEAVSGANAFAGLAAGDLIRVRSNVTGAVTTRVIVTYTSAAQVVVDSVITLAAGVPYTFLKQRCGTAVTDGWIDTGLFWMINFTRDIELLNATSIESQVECKVNGITTPTILDTKSVTVAGTYSYIIDSGAWDACRLGVKLTTDAGLQTVTARMLIVR